MEYVESGSKLEVSLLELDVPSEMEAELTWELDAKSWVEGI